MNDIFAGFNPTLPLERASTIPSNWYTDPRMVPRENRGVFGRSWLYAGRAELVEQPGQFLTVEIAGEPIMIVRGSDGVLRGFYNVCRHRAAPILDSECGTVGKLRCRYHGWTYDLEGRLRGTPEFDGVCDFRKEDNSLNPIAVEIWGPFVWVNGNPQPEPLEEFLNPLPQWANQHSAFSGLHWHQRVCYDLACNWKVYVDNYLDGGYHVNTVHPALAGAINYREYRTEVFANCSLQSSPLQPTEGAVGATRTGQAAYWWIFPNFMVNLYAGVMDTNLVLPLGPDRCRVVFDFYFGAEASEDFKRDSIAVAEQVQAEDILISEQVQRGLGSRSYSTGRFSVKREAAAYHFHRLLAERMRQSNQEGPS